MKCYFVETQEGVAADAAKRGLENIIGKGYVAFRDGSGLVEDTVMVKEGVLEKVAVYSVSVQYPKQGIMAFIGNPAYIKLTDISTGELKVPQMLTDLIANVSLCPHSARVVGRQG